MCEESAFGRRILRVTALALSLLAPMEHAAAVSEMHSYAIVNDDGTLHLQGRIVRLYAVYIPDTGRTCQTVITPRRCGSRAALALDFKKGANFVRCQPKWTNKDRSVTAVCSVRGEDLSRYLLQRGWAMALPGAPFEYIADERLAQHQFRGMWGLEMRAGQRIR